MGWKVVFSTRSATDLQKIVEFISRDDPAVAERFGLTLIGQAELLAHAPFIGVLMPERPGARLFPVGAYLIIYRPDTQRETVRILRFWHGARGARPLR
ncbi:MAG: type II toxin-antitoxin system RelE/ParE family toxin [Verrucomicrobiota bacterium]